VVLLCSGILQLVKTRQYIPFRIGVAVIISLLLLAAGCIWLAIDSTEDKLTVSFLDVGQGDAVLIETPSGTDTLIDGGRAGSVNRPLSRQLPFYNRTLDLVVGTHADGDHIGGLSQVFADYQVANVVLPPRISDTKTFQALKRSAQSEKTAGADIQQLSAGSVLRLGKQTYLLVLAPPKEAVPADMNDSSYVLKLFYGDTSMLLPGDISKPIEMYLAERYGQFLKADILKVAHHGSETSSARPFLSAVSPAHAVILAGKDNRHGHPDQVVVDRLKSMQASTTCTCDVGTVTFVSDGQEFKKVK
jgi:beta-lactamase superfamily II metal-dependent hydrolase